MSRVLVWSGDWNLILIFDMQDFFCRFIQRIQRIYGGAGAYLFSHWWCEKERDK